MFTILNSATLPTAFDTPMFWSEKELKELDGTSVVGLFECFFGYRNYLNIFLGSEKLGKEDAERDYHDKVFRVIQVCFIKIRLIIQTSQRDYSSC